MRFALTWNAYFLPVNFLFDVKCSSCCTVWFIICWMKREAVFLFRSMQCHDVNMVNAGPVNIVITITSNEESKPWQLHLKTFSRKLVSSYIFHIILYFQMWHIFRGCTCTFFCNDPCVLVCVILTGAVVNSSNFLINTLYHLSFLLISSLPALLLLPDLWLVVNRWFGTKTSLQTDDIQRLDRAAYCQNL